MLVVYRKADNKICGNSGTGPVIDRDYEIANAVLNFGGQVEDYEVIEAESLPRRFAIENKQLVELTEPDPEPTPPNPDDELAAAIEAATTLQDLKDALLGRVRKGRAAGKQV